MITISFKPQSHVALRKLFLQMLKQKGLNPTKALFPKDNYLQWEVNETMGGKQHSAAIAIFGEITDKNIYGYGTGEDVPLGCTVFAKSSRDSSIDGTTKTILFWALPVKKVRKKKYKEVEPLNLVDAVL